MGPGKGMYILGIWTDGPCGVNSTSVETLDGLWLYWYLGCMLGRAPRTKEAPPDFFLKIWILINGTQQCSIGLLEIDRNSTG